MMVLNQSVEYGLPDTLWLIFKQQDVINESLRTAFK